MLDGVAVTPRILQALNRHKVQFISPIRPNFGMAESEPDVEDIPNIFSRQLVEIVAELKLKKFILLGHMSGCLFSFTAAKLMPEKEIGIVNISGGVPILSTKQFSKQSPRQKAFAYTARYAPAILPALMKAGIAQIDIAGPQSLMHDMYLEGSVDKEVIKDPDIANVIMDGYRFAVAQGYKGFQGDAYHVTRNWSAFVRGTTKPVLLLHGAHDQVVTIDSVEQFAKREGLLFEAYPDDGQLVLYQKPNEILARIAKFYDDLTS